MLPMLKMLPALRRLRMLSTLAMLLRLNRLVPANLPCAQGARLGPRLDGRRPKGRATRAPLEAISGREASARGRCIGIELSFPWAARLRGIVPPAQSVASRATTLHGPCRMSVGSHGLPHGRRQDVEGGMISNSVELVQGRRAGARPGVYTCTPMARGNGSPESGVRHSKAPGTSALFAARPGARQTIGEMCYPTGTGTGCSTCEWCRAAARGMLPLCEVAHSSSQRSTACARCWAFSEPLISLHLRWAGTRLWLACSPPSASAWTWSNERSFKVTGSWHKAQIQLPLASADCARMCPSSTARTEPRTPRRRAPLLSRNARRRTMSIIQSSNDGGHSSWGAGRGRGADGAAGRGTCVEGAVTCVWMPGTRGGVCTIRG